MGENMISHDFIHIEPLYFALFSGFDQYFSENFRDLTRDPLRGEVNFLTPLI